MPRLRQTMTYLCNRCKDRKVLIECGCGCDKIITLLDKKGRTRTFEHGHNITVYNPNKGGKTSSKWKGGIRRRSDGYLEQYCPNHPFATVNKTVVQHRLVMEQYLGRYLTSNEVIHHKNGIRNDNRIENLQLFLSSGDHLRFELTDRKLSKETIQKMRGLKRSSETRAKMVLAWEKRRINTT